jgi:toxin ParE1/3/4
VSRREIRLDPRADEDVASAYQWYELQRDGLGLAFVSATDRCFERIAAVPYGYALLNRMVRRAMVPKFPYCVYYAVTANEIVILAVLHGRRDPREWQRRVLHG